MKNNKKKKVIVLMHDEWEHKVHPITCDSNNFEDIFNEIDHLITEDEVRILCEKGSYSSDEYTWFEIKKDLA